MAVTIRDIAQHLQFSVSTVSKALNGYADISQATREAVEKACKELGYFPNSHARALKGGKSYNLGVLFEDDQNSGLTHPFFSEVLESFKKEAEAGGYDVTFISHHLGSGRMTFEEHCQYRRIDGVCIAVVDFEAEEVMALARSSLPLVTIDRSCGDWPCVRSDNAGGMYALTRYTLDMGHRRIAFIHGRASASTNPRLSTFRSMLEEAGITIPPAYLVECDYALPDELEKAFLKLLELEERPSCIFCCDDYAAFGAYAAASKAGVRIPDDISIAGFDGIKTMQLMHPRLTTVWQDAGQIGKSAARCLIHLIEHPEQEQAKRILVPCRLLEGDTICRIGTKAVQPA